MSRYSLASAFGAFLGLAASSGAFAQEASRFRPGPGTRWHYQLSRAFDVKKDLKSGVQIYVIDLFDNPKSTVDALKKKGARVVCYFSAGSWEDWRPDAKKFAKAVLGKALDGWPGEKWLDVRAASLRPLMQARLDLCREKGFDGADLDNVDGYTQNSGFKISASQQLAYNRFLAAEAHARGLAVGLKNDVDQVEALVKDFDFAINEECFQYQECKKLLPFIEQGKAVFHMEYGLKTSKFCAQAKAYGFSSVRYGLELDGRTREACK
jgi:hypothetical protein